MSTLVLPDPCLVVMVGAAGSGKSALASRLFEHDEILSSDALRAAVSGSEADQSASRVAFRILHRMMRRRLAERSMTVVDATNTKAEDRRPLVAAARAAGMPTVAIVLDLPPEIVLAQNAGRAGRIVDPAVIDRHLAAIRTSVDSGRLVRESFDHVVHLRTPEDVARISIDRGPGSRWVAPGGTRGQDPLRAPVE